MKEVAVLILQFNSALYTFKLLKSFEVHESDNLLNYRVLVLDNGSENPMRKELTMKYKWIEYVQFDANYGFAAAHNKILPLLSEDWVLLLNNDTIFLNDAVAKTLDAAKDQDADFATCEILNEDKSKQINFWFSYLPTTLPRLFLHLLGIQKFIVRPIQLQLQKTRLDYIDASFLLIKNQVLRNVGFFNECHFMYGEDLDLMFRLKQKGTKGFRLAGGKVIHIKKGSSSLLWEKPSIQRRQDEETRKAMICYMPSLYVSLWFLWINLVRLLRSHFIIK